MVLIYPEEIKKLQSIYEPYMVNCKMRDDALLKLLRHLKSSKSGLMNNID